MVTGGTLLQTARSAFRIRDAVTLHTGGCVDDQGLALVMALNNARIDLPITWLTETSQSTTCLDNLYEGSDESRKRIRVIPRKSPSGVKAFASSRYVFFTHGLFGSHMPPRNRVVVNLWHGMPFKRIGGRPVHATYTTATSSNWRHFMADSFNQDPQSILSLGLPRNDRLTESISTARVRSALGLDDQPLIAWLPTYRNTKFPGSSTDGTDYGNPFNLPNASADRVNELAQHAGWHIVLKPHPYAVQSDPDTQSGLSMLTDEMLHDRGLTLYQLLGAADALITDYSSVWIDFLLTSRPIVFVTDDIREYAGTRGFNLTPPEDWLPGHQCSSLEGVIASVAESLDSDPHAGRRGVALKWHHDYPVGSAAERLIDRVFR